MKRMTNFKILISFFIISGLIIAAQPDSSSTVLATADNLPETAHDEEASQPQ